MPVVQEETAVPYTEEAVEKLFAAMNSEETVDYSVSVCPLLTVIDH